MRVTIDLTDQQISDIGAQLFKRVIGKGESISVGSGKLDEVKDLVAKIRKSSNNKKTYPDLKQWVLEAVQAHGVPVNHTAILRYLKKKNNYKGAPTTLFNHLANLVKENKVTREDRKYRPVV